jgi:hypothetical protein
VKRYWLLVPAGLCLAVAVFLLWRWHRAAAWDEVVLNRARAALAEGHAREVRAVARSRLSASAGKPSARDWLELELSALEAAPDPIRLVHLYEMHPDAFGPHERASLVVVRALVRTNRPADAARLRESWRGRETDESAWLALDADVLLSAGKEDEARQLLESRTFSGAADCGRLCRLAVLSVRRDPDAAWRLLTKAFDANPCDGEVRCFRAQMLEALGRYGEARVEYVAAYLAEPKDVFLRDQLAEFYRRRGDYGLALDTWLAPAVPVSDLVCVKARFWARVARPARQMFPEPVPSGEARPLAEYLQGLKPGEFWDAEAYRSVRGGSRYLRSRQETYWLRLIADLKAGRESEAAALLRENPFRRASWSPRLEHAVTCILAVRRGEAALPLPPDMGKDEPAPHSFLHQIAELACGRIDPGEVEPFLRSEEAFAAAFLAAGWTEAALALHRLDVIPAEYPDWLAYGLAQSLRENRGAAAALDFVTRQPASDPLSLLGAELRIARGQVEDGLRELTRLARRDSDVGYRASWLLCVAALDRRRPEEVQALLRAQPRLADSVTGKELLARCALLRGDAAAAERLYSEVAGRSVEARAYLARVAFARKEWARARELTLQLLGEMPDELQLRANLEAIDRAERGP